MSTARFALEQGKDVMAVPGNITSPGSQLLAESNLSVAQFNQILTILEIRGLIRPLGGNNWALA